MKIHDEATPYPIQAVGRISDMYSQHTGPCDISNAQMNRKTLILNSQFIPTLSLVVAPIMHPNKVTPHPALPYSKSDLLPKRSAKKTDPKVERKLMSIVMKDIILAVS